MEGTMADAQTSVEMSPKLQRVAERARKDPKATFNSLAHLIDENTLKRAFRRLRKDAAVGVDGMTVEEYQKDLDENLKDLHARLKAGSYRHQPIRRVQIPKDKDKTRPIGISTVADKVVQGALTEVLGAVYEPVFRECSYGFRPGRGPHDAVRALFRTLNRERVTWVLEADFQSYFDSINRKMLMEWLEKRVADGSIHRLVGKCLHVGVLDGEEFIRPDQGTVQGSIISPLLGNLYLHYVLDDWFEEQVKPRLAGKAWLFRYADDFVCCFENQRDAERVLEVLHKRCGKYDLRLHPTKTRLVSFGMPPKNQTGGRGAETFDLLGFTWHWQRSRKGNWYVQCETRRKSLSRMIGRVTEFCRNHRHRPISEQHAALKRKIAGFLNYFAVNGNLRSLSALVYWAKAAWHKWLRRRSQRSTLTKDRFYTDFLRKYPLPVPHVVVQLWS